MALYYIRQKLEAYSIAIWLINTVCTFWASILFYLASPLGLLHVGCLLPSLSSIRSRMTDPFHALLYMMLLYCLSDINF